MNMKKEYIWIAAFALLGLLSVFFIDDYFLGLMQNIQNPYLDGFFSFFSQATMLVLFGILMAIILWEERKRKYIWPFVASLIISAVLSFAIKFIVMRERPFGLEDTIMFTSIKDYSFPSSHAMTIFSALPVLDKEFKKFKWLFIVVACLITFSRLYFEVHYLSDVLFGGLFGYLIGKGILMLTEKR